MFHYIITFGFISIFFLAWCLLCIYKYRKWKRKRTNCTQRVFVEVKEILKKKTARGSVVYKPIFMTADGKNDIIDTAFYSSLVSFEIGQRLALLIDPENPKEFIYENDVYNKGRLVDILCCCLPFVFILGLLLARYFS